MRSPALRAELIDDDEPWLPFGALAPETIQPVAAASLATRAGLPGGFEGGWLATRRGVFQIWL